MENVLTSGSTAKLYEGFLALGIAAGGQLTTTDDVENYPGFKDIKGSTLMVCLPNHFLHMDSC